MKLSIFLKPRARRLASCILELIPSRSQEQTHASSRYHTSSLDSSEVYCPIERKAFSLLEKKALRQRTKKGVLPFLAPLILFSPGKGFQGQFIFILENLFPRPEILRQVFIDYPHLKVWQPYLMRALQILAKIIILPLKRALSRHYTKQFY